MSGPSTLVKAQLRHLALSRQGLTASPAFGNGAAGARQAIEHLGYIQIDTLSVIERAHHHVLWTRIPDYRPEHLHQLVRERDVFEYWFHAASYLPMRDYRFSLPQKSSIKNGTHRYFTNVDQRLMREIIDRVRIDGPLKARNVKTEKTGPGNWWNWGPGKRALETLFMQGDLMVLERNGMEKTYDLTERILPTGLNVKEPSLAEYAEYLVNTALRAHGCVTWKQLIHLITEKSLRAALRIVVDEKVKHGLVTALADADMPAAYVETQTLENSGSAINPSLRLLSPFDNAVIHRERLGQLFGFNYRLECYVPAPKRVYGYFCLPMLFGEQFVGRVDCKAHRGEKHFEVLSLHIENHSVKIDDFAQEFVDAVKKLANFNGCVTVAVRNTNPQSLLQVIRRELLTYEPGPAFY